MNQQDNEEIICSATRKNFKYILLWPTFDEELKPGKKYFFQIFVYIFLTSTFLLSVVAHLIVTILKNLDLSTTEDFALVAAMLGIFYMIFIYVKNVPKLAHLLRDLSEFNTFEKPPNFDEKKQFLDSLSNGMFMYSISALMGYSAIKLWQKGDCENINLVKGLEENCGFPAPIWTPFTITKKWEYCCVYIYIHICAQLLMKPNILITFHAFEVSQYVILKIDQLVMMVNECLDSEVYEVSSKKLKKCIQLHSEIINVSRRLDQCFSNGMMTHLAITAVICGCIDKQFAEGDHISATMHASGWISSLVFACVSGQLMINASEKIPAAIWFSKWYEADVQLQKDVLFFLTKSQDKLYLSVGPFDVLSYSLLVSVLKLSYSVFAYLNS